MSTHNPNVYISKWANCPVDILLLICRKLDLRSLTNVMFLNKHWQDVVEYYCQTLHFNILEEMVERGIDDTGLSIREKSTLSDRDIMFRAQQWYNIKNATVHLKHRLNFDIIKSICVHKDELIVVTNVATLCYKIEKLKRVKIANNARILNDETSSLSVTLYGTKYRDMTLVNKLHNNECECTSMDLDCLYSNISLYKVHFNRCCTVTANNVLRLDKAVKCKWDKKLLGKYYGSDPICGLHVHGEDVYVLLKRGDILRVDQDCKKLEKLFQLNLPMQYLDIKTFMFRNFTCLLLCSVPSEKEHDIRAQKQKDVIVAAFPGLTCVTEHGRVLLAGYENGKIEIFFTENLLQNVMTPELRFYLYSYVETIDYKITALDIYEGSSSHHLIVATKRVIYKFLISDT